MKAKKGLVLVLTAVLFADGTAAQVAGGPYREAGIPGFTGPDGQPADPRQADADVNPIFRDWAAAVTSYEPAPEVVYPFDDPGEALGPVTGDIFDIVSLGDLDEQQLSEGVPAGRITVSFDEPISRGPGFEIAVFENGVTYNHRVFAELGYVEVSSDGVSFARFASVSLTPGPVYYWDGNMATIDGANVHNLAGRHPNNYGACLGTPFDLDELAAEPNVAAGLVDLNNIWHVRIVDIPGTGAFGDEASRHNDPNTWPNWDYYDSNHPIYDPTGTWDSGGFDLEAVGALYPQHRRGDVNLDGIVDEDDLRIMAGAWLSHFGSGQWEPACDLGGSADGFVDMTDFAVLAGNWREAEDWRTGP